ncbi:MAG: mechanosensitive ion channel family protein [Actinomycetota bacterium]|nr:mechanosensitive ion channel family protein [Actinomycetota bacterium]
MLAIGESLYDLLQRGRYADAATFAGWLALGILVVVVGAFVATHLGSRAARRSVESLVERSTLPGAAARSAGRARTLGGVAASLVRVVVWAIAVLLVLDKFGINLGPLLAGASIVGVALGFGAQSMVKDFLSGFFILAEDQYGVGDVITIGDTTATVEEVNLRVTRMRGTDGTVWFIPNGEIRKVGNSHKEWSRAIVDVLVPPGADVAAACAAIRRELDDLGSDDGWSASVLEPPEVLGVEAMGVDGTTVRVAVKTSPDERAKVARDLRAHILARLRSDGVVPVPESPS